jgi:hypothetical protein
MRYLERKVRFMDKSPGYSMIVAFIVVVLFIPAQAIADNYASEERRDAALGHYARARTMLVEALAEFEQGREIARPDMLLDSEQWRLSIISRTEELNRLLDPQPKVTRSGTRFRASPHLIKRERDRLPEVLDGAKDSNMHTEEEQVEKIESSQVVIETPSANEEVIENDVQEVEAELMLPDAKDAQDSSELSIAIEEAIKARLKEARQHQEGQGN